MKKIKIKKKCEKNTNASKQLQTSTNIYKQPTQFSHNICVKIGLVIVVFCSYLPTPSTSQTNVIPNYRGFNSLRTLRPVTTYPKIAVFGTGHHLVETGECLDGSLFSGSRIHYNQKNSIFFKIEFFVVIIIKNIL